MPVVTRSQVKSQKVDESQNLDKSLDKSQNLEKSLDKGPKVDDKSLVKKNIKNIKNLKVNESLESLKNNGKVSSNLYFPTSREIDDAYGRFFAPGLDLQNYPKIPRLRLSNRYTIQGLMLTFFAVNMGKVVDKVDLVRFLAKMRVSTTDPQPRHLGMQRGFDFLNAGCWHPVLEKKLKPGQYCLLSLKNTKRVHVEHREIDVTDAEFTRMKKRYGGRCASCGSREDEPHFKNSSMVTRIERGHMDPRKRLTLANCIPMCSMCNGVYKNDLVFNKNGFVRSFLKKSNERKV